LAGAPASALDYEIMKIVEIGPADWVPMQGPLKWSPDGSKLAFFHRGELSIADTTGKIRGIKKFDLVPHLFEWISNDEISIYLRAKEGIGQNKLLLININSGQETDIVEFVRKRFPENSDSITDFDGPLRTVEGNVFYRIYRKNASAIKFIEGQSKSGGSAKALSENHFVRWGNDGLYMIKCDQSDSSRVARKPYEHMPLPPKMSSDRKYILMGGTMQRLVDSVYIVIDTIINNIDPITRLNVSRVFCGVIYESFNPNSPEVVFQVTCDDGHYILGEKLATYNYETYTYTDLEQFVKGKNPGAPSYSPDGRNIAYLAEGRAFILMRREIQ
jgi:hypothetical protein